MEITENLAQPKQKKMLTRRTKRAIFYTLLVIFPMFQWCVMYVGVHINTFVLAFQSYNPETYDMMFAGFKNFQDAWYYMFAPERTYLWKNSGIFILCSLCIKQTFTLFFSFYIYKKFPGAGLFKVMLFLPGIVSGLVYSWSFRVIIGDVLPFYFGVEKGLLGGPHTFSIMVFYNLWLGFGSQMLIYSSGMSSIDESIVEASQVDGATLMQEFWHITIPMISRTIMIFLITGLTTFFGTSLGLYDFFGVNAGTAGTIGYQVYVDTIEANYTNVLIPPTYTEAGEYIRGSYKVSYMTLSAIGLLESMFLIPVVTAMRVFINKVAPSAD